jgi:protein TonB
VAKPAPSSSEQAKPVPVPQAPAAPAEAVAKPATGPAAAPAAAAPSAPAGPAGSTSGVLLTETSATGETVDSLRTYRMAVAVQARRFKRYPAQAMASGWEGSADIRVEVGSDGRPRAATVARSSGHEPLDRAALAMIDAGALRARLPESLRGKAFAVVLPVFFSLDEQ